MRTTFLGTGCPTPNKRRSGAGILLEFEQDSVLVDCGPGVVRRLIEADVDVLDIGYVFFTHHHFDHTVDYPELVLTGWATGRTDPLHVYGAKGTEQLTHDLFERGFAVDIDQRASAGRDRSAGLVTSAQDVDADFVLEHHEWRVTARRVDHFNRNGYWALGYRFDAPGGSIVISGDTAPCDGIRELAQGAHTLVHEVLWMPELEREGRLPGRRVADPEAARAWSAKVKHTRPEELAAIAQEAGVERLVLTHLFSDTDLDELHAVVARTYSGEIVIAEDLTVLDGAA